MAKPRYWFWLGFRSTKPTVVEQAIIFVGQVGLILLILVVAAHCAS